MITINLLPEEFRVSEKKSAKPQALKIGLGLGAVVFLVTAFFYFDFLASSLKLRELEKSWHEKQPQFQLLTALRNEVDGQLKQEKSFMERFVTTDKPLTHLLVWVSEMLPQTAWLTDVTLIREEEIGKLHLQGVALPSEDKSSIEQIETYMQSMKSKMPDANLSLTTSRQEYEGVMVTQFVAHFDWRSAGV